MTMSAVSWLDPHSMDEDRPLRLTSNRPDAARPAARFEGAG